MSTEKIIQWRAVGVVSGVLLTALLVALSVALGLRMGTESQALTTSDSALRFVSPPDTLHEDQTQRRAAATLPLAQVPVSTGSLPLIARTQLCFPSVEPPQTFQSALGDLSAGWLRTVGDPSGRVTLLQTYRLADYADTAATRDGLLCLKIPPITLEPGEFGTHQSLFMTGQAIEREWLAGGSLSVVLATAPVLAWWEIALGLSVVVALALRLYVWSTTRGQPGLTKIKVFDVFACWVAIFIGWVLATAFVGKEPDVGLRTFVAMLSAILPVMVFPRWIAGRRHEQPRVAMRLVRPAQGWGAIGVSAGAGVALGVGAVAVLGAMVPRGSSHVQDIVSIPGGLLAFGTVWLLAAWYEELFYRGFAFGAILDRFGGAAAVTVTAVLQMGFAVPQRFGYLWPVVCGLVVAVAAGIARLRTDSAASGFALSLGYRAAVLAAIYLGWLSASGL
jgi:membrane protease YdiL (CAAX protease family)